MLAELHLDEILNRAWTDGIPLEGQFEYDLGQAVHELGILVGEGSLDSSDKPTTSGHCDPKQAVTATKSLASNPKAASVAEVRQMQFQSGPARSRAATSAGHDLVHATVTPASTSAGSGTMGARPVSAPAAVGSSTHTGVQPSNAIRPSPTSEVILYRHRASTGGNRQTSQALVKMAPINQALIRSNNAQTPLGSSTMIVRPNGPLNRPPVLDKLGKYVEASVERYDPRQAGIAFSGNFTPGGFGLRVRSQSQTVQHDARTGQTVARHSMETLQRDTSGNSRISNDRSDMEGSWDEIQQAMQSLQMKHAYNAW